MKQRNPEEREGGSAQLRYRVQKEEEHRLLRHEARSQEREQYRAKTTDDRNTPSPLEPEGHAPEHSSSVPVGERGINVREGGRRHGGHDAALTSTEVTSSTKHGPPASS